MKYTYIVLGLFLISCFFINYDNLQGIININYILDKDLRYRSSYGLNHPNTTGMICMVTFILYKFCKVENIFSSFEKYVVIIINCFCVIILLSTSSRNSIMGTLLFYTLFWIQKKYNLIGIFNNRYFKVAMINIILIFFLWRSMVFYRCI